MPVDSILELCDLPMFGSEGAALGELSSWGRSRFARYGEEILKKLSQWISKHKSTTRAYAWDDALWEWASAGLIFTSEGKWAKYEPTVRVTACSNSQVAEAYYIGVALRTSQRRAFCTGKGALGIGPPVAEHGDVIAVFPGGRVPLVLRPTADKYTLVGECYVSELMDGEAMDSCVEFTNIVLV